MVMKITSVLLCICVTVVGVGAQTYHEKTIRKNSSYHDIHAVSKGKETPHNISELDGFQNLLLVPSEPEVLEVGTLIYASALLRVEGIISHVYFLCSHPRSAAQWYLKKTSWNFVGVALGVLIGPAIIFKKTDPEFDWALPLSQIGVTIVLTCIRVPWSEQYVSDRMSDVAHGISQADTDKNCFCRYCCGWLGVFIIACGIGIYIQYNILSHQATAYSEGGKVLDMNPSAYILVYAYSIAIGSFVLGRTFEFIIWPCFKNYCPCCGEKSSDDININIHINNRYDAV